MAEHLQIEELMIKMLNNDFKPEKAESFRSRYFAIKEILYKEILQWIRSNEPELSDHSSDHIDNVLDNAYKLMENSYPERGGIEATSLRLSGLELYILCLTILFHDVGNFFGRKGHNQKIQTVLIDKFSNFFGGEHKREKNLITAAGRVHTGRDDEGSPDTLKSIEETDHSHGKQIRIREIASIVRFADELAEGPQRTCEYMLEKGLFSDDSEIYHKYARCTHIMIDAPNNRVNVTYDIDLNTKDASTMSSEEKSEIRYLLEFVHHRISKLDQERKYCGHYSSVIREIRETQISFNFSNNDVQLSCKIDPLVLNDLTIPGESGVRITKGREDLEIDAIISQLENVLAPYHNVAATKEEELKKSFLQRLFGGGK